MAPLPPEFWLDSPSLYLMLF